MKTSITFLGLVALTFTTANATNAFKSQDLDQQESATVTVVNNQNESQMTFVNRDFTNNNLENSGTDTVIFNPNSVVESGYVKTIEDVITENKLITESQDLAVQPLSLGYTQEDRISEDNQIIESSVSNEVYALDFEKINHTVKCVKMNTDALKTSDLKL